MACVDRIDLEHLARPGSLAVLEQMFRPPIDWPLRRCECGTALTVTAPGEVCDNAPDGRVEDLETQLPSLTKTLPPRVSFGGDVQRPELA